MLGRSKSNTNYKQGFCTNAEVFVMDEGIEMMPIENTSSEPQCPWWVKIFSIGEDMIVASFKACSCGQRQHKARFRERGGRTLQQAKFELIRQVNHSFKFIARYLD